MKGKLKLAVISLLAIPMLLQAQVRTEQTFKKG